MKRFLISLVTLGVLLAPAAVSALSSYAYVNNDGSLRIKGRTFRLYGLFIPPTAYTCQRFTTPLTCSSQVSIALDFRIGSNFVRCDPVGGNEDGTESAFCSVGGEDLGAYLINAGWAMALPNAPMEYALYERLARGRGFGIWTNPWTIYRYPP